MRVQSPWPQRQDSIANFYRLQYELCKEILLPCKMQAGPWFFLPNRNPRVQARVLLNVAGVRQVYLSMWHYDSGLSWVTGQGNRVLWRG